MVSQHHVERDGNFTKDLFERVRYTCCVSELELNRSLGVQLARGLLDI
jgi:hypothetical protein